MTQRKQRKMRATFASWYFHRFYRRRLIESGWPAAPRFPKAAR